MKGSFKVKAQLVLRIDHPKCIHQFMRKGMVVKFRDKLFNYKCTHKLHLYHCLGVNNLNYKRNFKSAMIFYLASNVLPVNSNVK
jgi:hypothetical protein